MKPLLVLVASFLITLIILKLVKGELNYPFAGRVAMAIMLIFTAMGHFIFSEGMTRMIPDFVPAKLEMVYFTGVLELIFAIGILIPKYRVIIGWFLIIFFILILPANIKAAIENVNYQTGELNGNGLTYLWFRIPLQILFILWIYFSVIKNKIPVLDK